MPKRRTARRKWRLTKTAERDLSRRLDGLMSTVRHAAHRADQMDQFAGTCAEMDDAERYEEAGNAFREVATDTIESVDNLAQERLAASERAEERASRAYESRRRRRRESSGF